MDPLKENPIISRAEHCWLSKNEWKVPPLPNTDWLFFTPLPWSQYCRGTVIFWSKEYFGRKGKDLFIEKKENGRRWTIAELFPNFWLYFAFLVTILYRKKICDNIVQRKFWYQGMSCICEFHDSTKSMANIFPKIWTIPPLKCLFILIWSPPFWTMLVRQCLE